MFFFVTIKSIESTITFYTRSQNHIFITLRPLVFFVTTKFIESARSIYSSNNCAEN